MPFDAGDLYTVTTGANIYNYWNPFVTKHDASSFYNWEQDNLPLYDLEERTQYLWEKMGWPASSVPGLVFAVSSTIPTDTSLSSNVFTSIEDAVAALPHVISMPVLIEVAVSGDLGEIKLNNLKFEGDGALEIINRVFTEFETTYARSSSISQASGTIREVYSPSAQDQIDNTQVLYLGANTSNLWPLNSARWDGLAFLSEWQSGLAAANGLRPDRTTTVVHNNNNASWNPNTHYWKVVDANDVDALITDNGISEDWEASSLNGVTPLKRHAAYTSTQTSGGSVTGFMTNNHLSGVVISNCDGPIYIRGFAVDGEWSKDWGIQVKNSERVLLENCGVTRSTVGGLKILNSDVKLNRRFCATRNYNGTTSSDRLSRDNYGIYALNSEIEFSVDAYVNGRESLFSFQEQDYGLYLKNSTVKGGYWLTPVNTTWIKCSHNSKAGVYAVNSDIEVSGYLDVYSNRTGLDLVASKLTIDGLICEYNKYDGLRAVDSNIRYGNYSVLQTAPYTIQGFGNDGIALNYKLGFFANGSHLNLKNSVYEPIPDRKLCEKHDASLYASHNGLTLDRVEVPGESQSSMLPAFKLSNSEAKFIHSRISTAAPDSSFSPNYNESYISKVPTYGVILQADNSKVDFLGSRTGTATIITGNNGPNDDCGIYLNSNSVCRFSGPTFIGQFGVAVLADNGSHAMFMPPSDASEQAYDYAGFNLSSTQNHTSVEIHSFGRCLVADHNSTISMKDLGHALTRYPSNFEQASATDFVIDYDYLGSSVSGGSMMLLPNPEVSPSKPGQAGTYLSKLRYDALPTAARFTEITVGNGKYSYYLNDPTTMPDFRGDLSKGGICVQAINNSTVKVQNVCFMTSPENTDFATYDYAASPAGCADLRIWAISNGSILDANTLAVSGLYPSLAGYTGPSAVYFDGANVAVSAFSHQPYEFSTGHYDISTVSVLDFFGIGAATNAAFLSNRMKAWSSERWGGAENYIGCSSSENSGPFRIYMDVAPEAKGLAFSAAGGYSAIDNTPYQLMAQGYMLSGPCYTDRDVAFAMFGQLLTASADTNTFEASGYYHTSAFVNPSRAIITLDESAANMFANAKHCSIPLFDRPKLVNIYRATDKVYGEAFDHSTSGYGSGFKGTNIFDLRRKL